MKKPEIKFYLTSTPQELKLYIKQCPSSKENIQLFLDQHSYNTQLKKWEKVKNLKKRRF